MAIVTWVIAVAASQSPVDAATRAVLFAPAVVATTWPLLSSVNVRSLDVHSSRLAVVLLMGLIMIAPTLYLWFVPSAGLLFAVAISRPARNWQVSPRR